MDPEVIYHGQRPSPSGTRMLHQWDCNGFRFVSFRSPMQPTLQVMFDALGTPSYDTWMDLGPGKRSWYRQHVRATATLLHAMSD